jgi:hypothetical protein
MIVNGYGRAVAGSKIILLFNCWFLSLNHCELFKKENFIRNKLRDFFVAAADKTILRSNNVFLPAMM